MFSTARLRLVAWNVFVLLLIMTALAIAVYIVFSSEIYTGVDQQLKGQQERIQSYLVQQGWSLAGINYFGNATPFDESSRTIIADSNLQVNVSTDCPISITATMYPCPSNSLTPASMEGLHEAYLHGQDLRTVGFGGEPERVYSYTERDPYGNVVGVFQTSRTVAGEDGALKTLQHLLLLGGMLGIILCGFGSFFLANRALIPIRQAFARQRQFTADASHELRTPLSLIRANAEMLARHGERLPTGDSELVEEIIKESDHLSRLVGDLLTLARADSEQAKITTRPVDMRTLVADVHEDVQRIAESRGIGSDAVLNGAATVDGDEVRLRQLLLILLDNALKYTDPGGEVQISLGREDGRVRLNVSDTGIGIPESDLPHIFERFYRVDRAREHESGGTGLGLAIARWIVDAHHGSIRVDSKVGQGTKFQVELPVSQT